MGLIYKQYDIIMFNSSFGVCLGSVVHDVGDLEIGLYVEIIFGKCWAFHGSTELSTLSYKNRYTGKYTVVSVRKSEKLII